MVRQVDTAGLSGADQRYFNASIVTSRFDWDGGRIRNGNDCTFRQREIAVENHYPILYVPDNDHKYIVDFGADKFKRARKSRQANEAADRIDRARRAEL